MRRRVQSPVCVRNPFLEDKNSQCTIWHYPHRSTLTYMLIYVLMNNLGIISTKHTFCVSLKKKNSQSQLAQSILCLCSLLSVLQSNLEQLLWSLKDHFLNSNWLSSFSRDKAICSAHSSHKVQIFSKSFVPIYY